MDRPYARRWSTVNTSSAYCPTYMTVAELREQFSTISKNFGEAARNLRPYTKVNVLMTFWDNDEHDNMDVGLEVDSLSDVFEASYHYNVEKFPLPSRGPAQNHLESRIRRMMTERKETDLQIFYYGGHGATDIHSPCIFRSSDARPNSVSFASDPDIARRPCALDLLRCLPCKVLIILDCCFAASAGLGDGVELLAACSITSTTPQPGPSSFTRAVIQQLQNAASTRNILLTPQLYARLVTRTLVVTESGERALQDTPVHGQMSQGATIPIVLAPNINVPSLHVAPIEKYPNVGVSVTLSVRLRDGTAQTMDNLRAWLHHNRPDVADRIDYVSWHQGFSGTLIFNVPVDLWYMMPDHPAMNFIAISVTGDVHQHRRRPPQLDQSLGLRLRNPNAQTDREGKPGSSNTPRDGGGDWGENVRPRSGYF